MIDELRHAFRVTLKNPGLATIVILALGLAIGANTAMFSIVSAVLLRPLPYAKPNDLCMIWEANRDKGAVNIPTNPANFSEWRRSNQAFEDIALSQYGGFALTGVGEPASVRALEITPNIFQILGVPAEIGRTFIAGKENDGLREVVVSQAFWQRNLGGDRSIVGRNIFLNEIPYAVAGIMPAGFQFPPTNTPPCCDMWVRMTIDTARLKNPFRSYFAYGRLRPGVTVMQAQDQMDGVARRIHEVDKFTAPATTVVRLQEQAVQKVRPVILMLFAAVVFILLIACANVASLLLARGTARLREISTRAALGAGPWRIMRQLLIESLILGAGAWAAGLLLGHLILQLFLTLHLIDIPPTNPIRIDGVVLLFMSGISILTSILFGTAAGWQARRSDLLECLKEAGRTGAGGAHSTRVRGLLLVTEVALSLVLLVGAGLMLKTLWRLMQVDPGFNPRKMLTFQIGVPGRKTIDLGKNNVGYSYAFQDLLTRIASFPAVQAVALTNRLPIVGISYGEGMFIEGQPPAREGDSLPIEFRVISPGYFKTMQIRLLAGRTLTDMDGPESARVVVINEMLAKRYFPNESPLGKHVTIDDPLKGPWYPIVGIVGDVKHFGLSTEARPELYTSYLQSPKSLMTFVIRTSADPMAVAGLVRGALHAADKNMPVPAMKSMEQVLSDSIVMRRFNAALLMFFSTLALLLTAIGMYGFLSQFVVQRIPEIGIRMALGATRWEVLRLVLSRSMTLVVTGLVIGVLAALALARLISGLLFGVGSTDWLTFAIAIIVLLFIAVAASSIPALRASRVDPLTALRYE